MAEETNQLFTREELKSRNKRTDAILIIHNEVYDVTQFLDEVSASFLCWLYINLLWCQPRNEREVSHHLSNSLSTSFYKIYSRN